MNSKEKWPRWNDNSPKSKTEKKKNKRRKDTKVSPGGRSAIATPGRLANATPKFMPPKRGRLGF
jgi:hypothetical protein